MAAACSPAPGLPTPAASTKRSSTAPAPPKLRDSCHACASSKLKCYKEKPTCSRCAKRGLVCEYVATRRGGRKHDTRLSISHGSKSTLSTTTTSNEKQPIPPLNDWFSTGSTVSITETLPSSGVVRQSPAPATLGAPYSLFSDDTSTLDQPLTGGLEEFLASPMSFSGPVTTDANFLDQAHFFCPDLDSSSSNSTNLFDNLTVSEDSISDLFTFSNSQSPPTTRASSTSNPQPQQAPGTVDSTCFCLNRALGLMKQFSPNPSTAETISSMQAPADSSALASIRIVIAKNEHAIDAVSSMLDCSCSQDSYLLAIMSLIIFKVLGCYATAAVGQSRHSIPSLPASGKQTPLTVYSRESLPASLSAIASSQYSESDESVRMAAQLVLSELHRVQRFVNQLSNKLKARAARNEAGTEASSFENTDGDMTSPLSAVMLEQLEVDLRRRLRGLSVNIVEGLRER